MWKIRKGLDALNAYSIEEDDWAVKLDANERPRNLPPRVMERLMERLAALQYNRYPEITPRSLREKIAGPLGLKADNVVIGNGSSELLAVLCYVFGGQGRKIVFPQPSFSMYFIYTSLADSQSVPVNLNADFTLSAKEMLDTAIREEASLIILCTPNNPTGTVMPFEDIEYIAAGAKCPVVVDEAYNEYYGKSAIDLLAKYPNLVVLRTFSKAYGLAAARVGYALAAKEIVDLVDKALTPFYVNNLSLTAAATVFEMRDEFAADIAETVAERERIEGGLSKIPGISVVPSQTNFVLFKCAEAAKLNSFLMAKSIAIRNLDGAPGLTSCLRVTVGTPAENDAFLAAVADYSKK